MLAHQSIFVFFMEEFWISFNDNQATLLQILLGSLWSIFINGIDLFINRAVFTYNFNQLNKMQNIGQSFQTPTKHQYNNYYVNPDLSLQSKNKNQYPFDATRLEVSEYIPYKRVNSNEKEKEKYKNGKNTEKKLSVISKLINEKTQKKHFIKIVSQYKSVSKNIQPQQEESQIANEENYEESQYKINTLDNHFMHFTKQDEFNQQFPQNQKEQFQIIKPENQQMDKLKPKKKIILANRKNKIQSNMQSISQSFRYCIGCLQPVLQANIKVHEECCRQFQRIFDLNQQQLIFYLKTLIKDLSVKVKQHQQQLSSEDVQQLNLYTNSLLHQTQQSARDRHNLQYAIYLEQIKTINKKWISYAEQICKINWFITLQQRINCNSLKK